MSSHIDFDHIIVVGANSGIARIVIPELQLISTYVDLVYRTPESDHFLIDGAFKNIKKENIRVHIGIENLKITNLKHKKILIINFAGVFGLYEEFFQVEPLKVLEVINQNLESYLIAAKFILSAGKDSTLIGFSGAGVGGDSIELGNLGYLMSKSAICLMFESLAKSYRNDGRHFILIAPGAFPTKMQEAPLLSTSKHISENRRELAANVLSNRDKHAGLAGFIQTLATDPATFSGKIVSFVHDNLSQIKMSKNENFGKLRRIYD